MLKFYYEFPSKLSQAIQEARTHLKETIENDPCHKYKYDPELWHEYFKHENICYICLSGALLVKGGINIKENVDIFDIEELGSSNIPRASRKRSKLLAINTIRNLAEYIFKYRNPFNDSHPYHKIQNHVIDSIRSYYSPNNMMDLDIQISGISNELYNLKQENQKEEKILTTYEMAIATIHIQKIYAKYGM